VPPFAAKMGVTDTPFHPEGGTQQGAPRSVEME
jgi:hypothetical protein